MNKQTRLEIQLAKMAADVEKSGRALIKSDDAEIPELSLSGQYGRLAEIAKERGWTFTFVKGGYLEFRKSGNKGAHTHSPISVWVGDRLRANHHATERHHSADGRTEDCLN